MLAWELNLSCTALWWQRVESPPDPRNVSAVGDGGEGAGSFTGTMKVAHQEAQG